MTDTNSPLLVALLALVGKKVSAVVFIEGYIQIEFSSARISILTQMVLRPTGEVALDSAAAAFPHSLLSCVGSEVRSVQEQTNDLVILLSNEIDLRIKLANPSPALEALIYEDSQGRIWVA